MNTRSEIKAESLSRILDAGAKRLRTEGLSGSAITDVMRDAGLTHGAFYVHFANKAELSAASLRHALLENRKRWVGELLSESWLQRLQRLARRYLNKAHCDNPADGCALGALATEAGRSDQVFRRTYEEELLKSLHGICNGSKELQAAPSDQQFDDAIALMALCVGGLSLSRAVIDKELSERILQVCTDAAGRIASSDLDSDEREQSAFSTIQEIGKARTCRS